MKKKLWILLAIFNMTILTSCEDLLDGLLDAIDDNPVPSTPSYNNNATIPDDVYVASVNQPNATNYMPKPPSTDDVDFIDDKVQWEWGKYQRGTERGATAKEHMGRSPKVMCKVMAQVLGLSTISKETTPALERLLNRAYHTGEQSAATAKMYYKRQRPFVVMGESAWYDADAQDATGSYTSATSAAGWAVGLAFAEMWPPLQNKILKKAFQFGEDRVISGSNFQSDVDGGYSSGAASIAQAHNDPKLQEDILAAREEYKRLIGQPSYYDPVALAGTLNGEKIINAPIPCSNSEPRYGADLKRYQDAKKYRNTTRGEQAVMDADASSDRMAAVFGEILGFSISPSNAPNIYTLIKSIRYKSVDLVNRTKINYFRLRPFAQLHESTPVPSKENTYRENSSYPSGHTCYAWSLGLVLAEVAPARQNKILHRAYDFGFNRVIVGYHWPTDVDAGRVLAASLVAQLHSDEEFCNQLKQAKAEYQKLAK